MIYSKKLERKFIFRHGRAIVGGVWLAVLSMVICIAAVAQHHHFVRNDLHTGMFLTFLIIPAACLQTTFHINLLSLYKILLADLGKVSPGDYICLLYTSDAADERSSVDLGGRRIIKKKTRVECRRPRVSTVRVISLHHIT